MYKRGASSTIDHSTEAAIVVIITHTIKMTAVSGSRMLCCRGRSVGGDSTSSNSRRYSNAILAEAGVMYRHRLEVNATKRKRQQRQQAGVEGQRAHSAKPPATRPSPHGQTISNVNEARRCDSAALPPSSKHTADPSAVRFAGPKVSSRRPIPSLSRPKRMFYFAVRLKNT